MAKLNGGPAFPYSALSPEGPSVYKDSEGMSVRDWFAGKALNGLLACPDEIGRDARQDPDKAAFWSYEYADAMLAERNK